MTLKQLKKTISNNKKILKAYKNDDVIGIMTNENTVMLQFADHESGNIGKVVFILKENK